MYAKSQYHEQIHSTLLNVFNHTQTFSGGKSAHGHVVFGSRACSQRINGGRVAQNFIFRYYGLET